MKNIVQLTLAGIIGGAIAFGAFSIFNKNTVVYEQIPAHEYATSLKEETTTAPYNNSPAAIATSPIDFVIAAEKANPAVVHISAKNQAFVANQGRQRRDIFEDFFYYRRQENSPQAGTGSGVLISNDGYIVTNNHVVGFADFIEVTTQDGQKYEAKKLGTDPSTDLAVIKIEGRNLPNLKFADSDMLKVGQWVVAVGNPFNLTSTVTAGIVSAKGRDLDIIRGQKTIEEFIQTDAVVNPGNSGGALVNTQGDLVGINTAISSPTGVYAGYSFAIPSNLVSKVVAEIKETGGDIQRGMLGIRIADVDVVKQEGLDVKAAYGVYVADFNTDVYGRKLPSSAEYAGLEIGDVIIKVDDAEIKKGDDLQQAIKFAKVGDTLNVTVDRNGKKKTIPVKLRQGI